MKTIFTILICFLVFYSLPSFGQPGTLDIDFDSDGKVTTNFGGFEFGFSVAIQTDGKILVAGYSHIGSDWDFAVARYNTDGSLDNTFGSGGKVTTDFDSTRDEGYSLAIQADEKILVAGTSEFDFALVRYNIDGSLDNTFGTCGKVTTDLGGTNDEGRSVAIQADGKIVVAGSSDHIIDYDFALVRYHADGSIDNTFSADGKVTTDFGSSADHSYSIAIQPDGKMLVAGHSWNGTDDDFALARYNTDGTLDNTFSADGKVTTGIGINDYGYSVAIQPDGKILVAGYSGFGAYNDFSLVRYQTDGTLDSSFGGAGKVTTDIVGYIDIGSSVNVQPDGKILIAGTAGKLLADDDFALVRYNADGTLDNMFGIGGKVTTDFGSDDDVGLSLAIDPDGKIVVAGRSNNVLDWNFAVARYLSGLNVGVVDFSTEDQATLIYPNPIQDQATLEYTLTQEERMSIRLVDMSGKVIKTFVDQESRSEGEHIEEMDFPSIPAGNYLLVIENGEGSQSIKVIIQ